MRKGTHRKDPFAATGQALGRRTELVAERRREQSLIHDRHRSIVILRLHREK